MKFCTAQALKSNLISESIPAKSKRLQFLTTFDQLEIGFDSNLSHHLCKRFLTECPVTLFRRCASEIVGELNIRCVL